MKNPLEKHQLFRDVKTADELEDFLDTLCDSERRMATIAIGMTCNLCYNLVEESILLDLQRDLLK